MHSSKPVTDDASIENPIVKFIERAWLHGMAKSSVEAVAVAYTHHG